MAAHIATAMARQEPLPPTIFRESSSRLEPSRAYFRKTPIVTQVLPVKWQHSAPDATNLPSMDAAIRAFRRVLQRNGDGFVSEFHERHRRICVLGCKLAVESSADQTLHVRMRPPGAPWILNAEMVATWPELGSFSRTLNPDFARASWLRVAAADLFEAWSRDFLPQGYRYQNPLHAVIAALPALTDYDNCIRHWHRAIRSVLPNRFWRTFKLSEGAWASLPDIAAPMRVWNAHREEVTKIAAKEPWIRSVVHTLAHTPPDLRLGETIEQSIKALIIGSQSKTVWRFHRDTEFDLINRPPGESGSPEVDCDLLLGEGGHYAGQIIVSAVKALGMERAKQLLTIVSCWWFKSMVVALRDANCADADLEKLPRVLALAWKEQEIDSMQGRWIHKGIAMVIGWLASEGFARGHPARNATWPSLMRPAEEWDVIVTQSKEMQALQDQWTAAIPAWHEGEVHFTAIESRQSLNAEGRQMGHCVAGYFRKCALGASVIYRVEGALPDGKRVRATAEFVRKSGVGMLLGKKWKIAQLKGPSNRKVDERVRKIAGRLALELAIAAFGCEIEKSGNGPIREFRSAERHLCVFGGRLALECTDDNTVQVRMRPPGASGTRTAKN